jgi:hypothetical protein
LSFIAQATNPAIINNDFQSTLLPTYNHSSSTLPQPDHHSITLLLALGSASITSQRLQQILAPVQASASANYDFQPLRLCLSHLHRLTHTLRTVSQSSASFTNNCRLPITISNRSHQLAKSVEIPQNFLPQVVFISWSKAWKFHRLLYFTNYIFLLA